MTYKKFVTALCIAALATLALTSPAQSFIPKANNANSLDDPASWVGGSAPNPLLSDVAVWDSTVSTPANCTNTLAGGVSWGGIVISNPAVSVKILTNGLPAATGIYLDSTGITLTNTANLWVAPKVMTTADQIWTIGSGRILTLADQGRSVDVNDNVTINGAVVCKNFFNVHANGILTIPDGTTVSATLPASTTAALNIGTSGGIGAVNQTGGSVTVTRTDGTTSSPKATLAIGNVSAGTYNISGGSLVDGSPSGTSPGTGRFDMGQSAGAGVLNISGTGSVQCQSRLQMVVSGGDSTINVTNGSLNILGELRMGTVNNGTATVNVYGGVVSIGGEVNLVRGGTGQTAYWNSYGGDAYLSSFNLPRTNGGVGTLTISAGTITVTNNLEFRASGTGTVNLDGGLLTVGAVTYPSNTTAALNFNGGTLKPRVSIDPFIAAGVTANVQAGGAVIDTANFNISLLPPLLGGAGDGGLKKLGSGRLTLSGPAGTYTGTTRVNAGTFAVCTTNHCGGAIVVSNNAALQVTLTNSTTMNCASLTLGTLGTSLGGTNSLNCRLGSGNPLVPVINASSLAAAGTVLVSVNGSGLSSANPIHLIHYGGAVSGSDFIFKLDWVTGEDGYVTNNTATHNLDLVITTTRTPAFGSVVLAGGNLEFSGINGTANASYRVLAASNVASPLNLWAPIATNNFDSNGNFSFTNAVNPAKPSEFYRITVP